MLTEKYGPAGRDFNGRSVLWVVGGTPIAPQLESAYGRANILSSLAILIAIHSDPKSLREGFSFVVDTSRVKTSSSQKKSKNDAKLQKFDQSFPLRAQSIQIAGTSPTLRIFINALIKLASVFTKKKILDRIQFVSLEEAKASIPSDSVPKHLGGNGGGINDVVEWVKMRVEQMPTPEL